MNINKYILLLFVLYSKNLNAQKIPEYLSYTKYLNEKYFTGDKQLKFDKNGQITIKGINNVLKASVYGIWQYEMYVKTQDVLYKNKCLSQLKFITNPDNYHTINEGKGVIFPYLYNRHGLKSPWYSGLTQGVATSYLIRCFLITNDSTLLYLSKKTCLPMSIPTNINGGSLNKTKEGFTWIEEYPGKNSSKTQVMNGFISSIVGLHEYLLFFKEDTTMKRLYDECLETLSKTLPKFDTYNWSNYDRYGGAMNTNYFKLQIEQLNHLYQLTNKRDLYLQKVLWCTFVYGKNSDYKRDGHINHNYDYSVPLNKSSDNIFTIDTSRTAALKKRTNSNPPLYTHFTTNIDTCLNNEKVKVKVKAKYKPEVIVYFRSNKDHSKVSTTNWKTLNSKEGKKVIIEPENKFYQLRIVVNLQEKWPEIKKITIDQI